MNAIVLISSIPERKESLKNLLGDLQKQTRLVPIWLFGDGYETKEEFPRPEGHIHLEILRATSPRKLGPGNRWLWISRSVQSKNIHPDTIVINLDDDVRLSPTAIADTIQWMNFITYPNCAVAWAGREATTLAWLPFAENARLDRRQPQYSHDIVKVPLFCAAACAIRAQHIEWLEEHEEAGLLLGVLGDDELLLADHLRAQNVTVIRPSGPSPVGQGAGTFDEHAQFKHKRSPEVQAAKKRCFDKFGYKTYPESWFL